MADQTCTEDCGRPIHIIARNLCGPCYQRHHKAGTLTPLPPLPSPPHTCQRHQPSTTCYVACKCRCRGCRDAIAANGRQRTRAKAYGRYRGYVDADPVRAHVRQLMAPRVGSTRGMGWKRIARLADVPNGAVSKLLYGDHTRGTAPSRRIKADNADRLLAVQLDLADGATIPAGPTTRRIDALTAGGFTRAELARYITGDVTTVALQIRRRGRVTVANARKVEDLHRRWQNDEIIPRGRRSRWEHGPPSPFPHERQIVLPTSACEDCGGTAYAGGRWCWDCYRTHSRSAA